MAVNPGRAIVDNTCRLKEEGKQMHGRKGRRTRRAIPGPPHRLGLTRTQLDEITAAVMSRLNGTPDMRMELVGLLRMAVMENRYFVPEEKVAESMIRCCLSARLT